MFPTSMAAGPLPEANDHRRSARHRIESLAYIALGADNGGVLLDFGEGGTRFQAVQPLEIGRKFHIHFKLPGTKATLEATGEVVWLNESRNGGGLRFSDLPERTRELVKEWLSGSTASPEIGEADVTPSTVVEIKQPQSVWEPRPASERDGSFDAEKKDPAAPLQDSYISRAAIPPFELSRESAVPPGVLAAQDLEAQDRPQEGASGEGRARARLWARSWSWQFAPRLVLPLAGIAIFGVVLLVFWRRHVTNAVSVTTEATGNSQLGLKLERTGTDWQVSWNRNAEALVKAIGGHLSITDGAFRKELDLGPSELRSGSIMYTPATDDVVVRLQVVSGNLEPPVGESVRILAGKLLAAPAQTVFPSSSARGFTASKPRVPPAPPPSSHTEVSANAPSASSPTTPALSPANIAPPPKADVPGPLSDSGKLESTAGSVVPGPVGTSSAASSALPVLVPTKTPEAASKPPATVSAALLPPVATTAPSPPVSNLVPAQLILKREAIYPAIARQMGLSGSVELHFRIGPEGKVRDVTVVKGNPMLAGAAVDAVKTWRYKAAQLNGTSIDTESTAVIEFRPK